MATALTCDKHTFVGGVTPSKPGEKICAVCAIVLNEKVNLANLCIACTKELDDGVARCCVCDAEFRRGEFPLYRASVCLDHLWLCVRCSRDAPTDQ